MWVKGDLLILHQRKQKFTHHIRKNRTSGQGCPHEVLAIWSEKQRDYATILQKIEKKKYNHNMGDKKKLENTICKTIYHKKMSYESLH